MSQKIKSLLLQVTPGIIIATLLVTTIVYAWREPIPPPPGGNIPAPLNVGPAGQTKIGNLILNTGGSPTGLIVQHGNVGIGTTAPAARLNVAGGHGNTTLRLSAGPFGHAPAHAALNNAFLSLWASEPGWTWTGAGIGNNIAGHPHFGRINTARGGSYIRLLDNQIAFNTINAAGADVSNMFMSGGNVGIGTTAPAARLDVAGNARIAGTLNMSNRRIINVATPVAGADAATKAYVDAAVAGAGGRPGTWICRDISVWGDRAAHAVCPVEYTVITGRCGDTAERGWMSAGVSENGWACHSYRTRWIVATARCCR